jgi:hypothetical protein
MIGSTATRAFAAVPELVPGPALPISAKIRRWSVEVLRQPIMAKGDDENPLHHR